MSNWCYNILKTESNSLILEFKRIKQLYDETSLGQRPFDSKVYLFDIDIDINANDNIITYSTKWDSNADDIFLLSELYDFDFDLYYEELGNLLLGEIRCRNGIVEERYLTGEDFNLIEYNEDTETYSYKGITEYSPGVTEYSPCEFYQNILENKEWIKLNENK